MDGTVLVADDDRTIRTVLTQALTRAGCHVHATSSLGTLIRWVSEGKGDAIITDVKMPDGNGIEMIPKIIHDRPDLPIIIISAQNTIMTAIKAKEARVFDYLPKPFDLMDLMSRCSKALDKSRSKAKSAKTNFVNEPEKELPLIGKSSTMQELYKAIAGTINLKLPLLITGESGTGKTLISKILHDFSDRRYFLYQEVSESELADDTFPNELLEKAKNGSVVFEQIHEMCEESQKKLINLIDNVGENGPRIITTIQGNVLQSLDKGQIREDLFYRLGGGNLIVPPLRERLEDIETLINNFISKSENKETPSCILSSEAKKLFFDYDWPGNVRQLKNIVQNLMLFSNSSIISMEEAELALKNQPEMNLEFPKVTSGRLSQDVEQHLRRYFELHNNILPASGLYNRVLREVEMPLIDLALEATRGNQAKCAEMLGINRNTLRKKIKELDIKVTRRRKVF